MRSRVGQILVGFAVSALLLAWLALAVEWPLVWDYLKNAHYWAFLPVTALILLQFLLRTWRWRLLIGRPLPGRLLFDGLMFGNFGNYLLPLRAGEFMRPALVARESGLSFSSLLASVVIERFFDLSMVLLSFGVLVMFLADLPPLLYQGAVLLTVLAAGLFVFGVVGSWWPAPAERFLQFFLNYLPLRIGAPLLSFARDFLGGAAVFRRGGNLSLVVLLTFLIWLSTFFQYYATLFLFDLPATFFFGAVIAVILALGVAAPSAPGFIGPFQGAVVLAFVVCGESKEAGTAYAVLAHIHQYLLVLLLGAGVLLKYGLGLRSLQAATPPAAP